MTRRSIHLAGILFLTLLGACASSGAGGGANRDLITLEEIRESTATDLYHLIRSLRPRWLQTRGALTAAVVETDDGAALANPEIVVYLDGARLEGLAELEGIPTAGVTRVERLNVRDATQRFGTGHPRGAIVISRDP